jgi:hypothetical protein
MGDPADDQDDGMDFRDMKPKARQSSTGKGSEAGQGPLPSDTAPPFTAVPEPEDPSRARIERARRLLADQAYPSETVIQSVARHLARNWPSTPGTEPPLQPPRA